MPVTPTTKPCSVSSGSFHILLCTYINFIPEIKLLPYWQKQRTKEKTHRIGVRSQRLPSLPQIKAYKLTKSWLSNILSPTKSCGKVAPHISPMQPVEMKMLILLPPMIRELTTEHNFFCVGGKYTYKARNRTEWKTIIVSLDVYVT